MALRRSPPLLRAFALAFFAAAAASPNSEVATNVLLTAYVESAGARCLDGSPYEIWVARSPSASPHWVIDIMGGAWCGDLASCEARAYAPQGCFLGSSSAACFNADSERCADKAPLMPFSCLPACNGARWCGGLMTNSSATNPLTAAWNKVLLPYKDGGSFAGDNDTVTMSSSGPLYFRGHRNFLAAIDYLVRNEGLGAAGSEVILSGNSAGGLATFLHADELASLLPLARVTAAPDSGFFATDPAFPSWGAELLHIVEMMNATRGLDASCVAAIAAAGGDPATCAFPEVGAQHVETPLFVLNGRFDPALDGITEGESGANATHVNLIGQRVLALANSSVLQAGGGRNAAFITSCAQHCGQWSQGTDGDFDVVIDGDTAIDAMIKWRAGERSLWVQPHDFPCADCCSGGNK